MNSDNLPHSDEIKRFYTLFCEVFTAFHNYAVAKKLFENKIYSWSLTAYYYSLMHCGRAICYMSLNCFPKRHEDLHKLLRGENLNNRVKFWRLESPEGVNETHNFEELIRRLPQINGGEREKIRRLGNYLEKIKKIREFNSYEMFIVAHQTEHAVLSPKLQEGTEKIDKIVEDYLIFISKLLFHYTEQKGEHFKAFLLDKNQNDKWAFEYLRKSLREQKLDEGIIERIIKPNLLDRLACGTNCPNEFYDKISFRLFDEKQGIIKNFMRLFDEVKNEPH